MYSCHIMQKEPYLSLHRAAHNNAIDLLAEAEILFEKGRYSRAYSLAFTALEEISKSQLAADVFTGYITEDEFQGVFLKHEKKIKRMAWATNDAEDYLSSDGTIVEVQKPKFTVRNDALYVNLKDDKVYSPSDVIGREQAQGIMHTVELAFQRIFEVTELWGPPDSNEGVYEVREGAGASLLEERGCFRFPDVPFPLWLRLRQSG